MTGSTPPLARDSELGRLRRLALRRVLARRIRMVLRWSMLPIPCLYVAVAVALGLAAPTIDHAVGTPLQRGVGLNAARDVLTATATGMVAFTALVVASVLLVIQFAASQYSPRLVLWFRRDFVIKNAIGSFLAAPLFGVVALREIERRPPRYSPDVTVVIALVLLVGAAVLFLALLQRIQHRLEPRRLYQAVARDGIRSIRTSYPLRLEEPLPPRVRLPAGWRSGSSGEVRLAHGAGVLVAFERDVMARVAAHDGVTIELVPAIGEYVSEGQPLLRIHGDGSVDHRILLRAVTIGEERMIDEPAFAIRIIVDTAIRALSPAINDPTTAVHAIDALEPILRELAARNLEPRYPDSEAATRLVWRAPTWEDLLDLAFEEIRAYGRNSVQVCRRLRAALEDLRASTPHERHSAIDVHLARLDQTVQLTYPTGSPDRSVAAGVDRTGLGLPRPAVRDSSYT